MRGSLGALLAFAAALCHATAAARPAVLVTAADGPEGSAMVASLLQRKAELAVVAGVEDTTSSAAAALRAAGAEVRELPTKIPSAEAFKGVQWVFLLAPLTADRQARGQALMDAAWSAGTPQAALLSVIGASAEAPSSLGSYFALEKHLASRWPEGKRTVLRTYFYQQNLLLWAADVQATGLLRLPLEASSCFAPLYEADVAGVVAALMLQSERLPEVFNLTGPDIVSGPALAEAAARASGASISFQAVDRQSAAGILKAAGGLDASEAELVLDLMALQTSQDCSLWPSKAVPELIGHVGRNVTTFFTEHAADYRRKDGTRILFS